MSSDTTPHVGRHRLAQPTEPPPRRVSLKGTAAGFRDVPASWARRTVSWLKRANEWARWFELPIRKSGGSE